MEIQELWRILRERWLIVAIVTLVFVIGSLVWYFVRPLDYKAQTRVVVSTSGGTGTAVDAYAGERVAQLRTPSYAELIRGPEVALRASRKLNGEISPGAIQGALSTRIAPDQPLITLSALDSNPGTALKIVEAVQKSFQEYVAEIERPGATGALTSVEITTDQPTVAPDGHWKRDTVLAGVIGLLVGTLLAVIRDRTDPVMRKPGQLSSTGLPYLGTVKDQGQSSSDSLEDFRRIALESLINAEAQTATRLLVVGVDAESNSWTVARGMADALASYGKKVTLVDVVGNSGVPSGKPGLSDYLAGIAEWSECATPTLPNISEVGAGSDGENLDAYFLAGRLPQTPLPLRRGEYAVIAGPSIVHTPVAVALTSIADVGLLVATTKSSRLADIDEARYTLQAMNLTALGVIFLQPPKRKSEAESTDGETRKDEVAAAS
jgi:capsular polysaccharide biosynthesis protein